jgi:hypothetical protein
MVVSVHILNGIYDMASEYDVAVFVGSLRKDSINRKVAQALVEVAPPSMKLGVVEIGHLPLYNQDEEANPPSAWTELRERVKAAHAVLFVTPEYNRSIPAPMKNVFDVASRPYGKNAWDGKPGALARSHWWIRSKSSPAAVTCFSQRSCDAAARGLHRARRQTIRCNRQAYQRGHTKIFARLHAVV